MTRASYALITPVKRPYFRHDATRYWGSYSKK